MKKIFTSIFSLFLLANIALAQGKFSASITNVSNTLTFKLKPVGGNITTGLSTIEFFVRHPNPGPAFSYSTVTPNTTNFPGMTASGTLGSGSWEIERDLPIYVLPGFHTDHFIYTAPAPNTGVRTYNDGVEYDVISVNLLGPTNIVDLQFIHQDIETTYYLAITSEIGADLRPAAFTNYFYPVTSSAVGPAGSTFYFAALNSVPIPVKFGGFTATKRENSAVLNWWVENESAITDHYEVERSFNGRDFIQINNTAAKNNGSTSNTYQYTEADLKSLRSDIIYYRIKQLDKDGKFVYTEIRSVRLDKSFLVNIFPNPVVDNIANVNIDLIADSKVNMILSDAAGKEIMKSSIEGKKGLNLYKLNMAAMAAGTYQLKINAGTETKVISVVKEINIQET